MRKLIVFLFLFSACAFGQAQAAQPKPALNWCQLGADPVDSTRQPDWAAECVVKAASTPVTMLAGSGRRVECLIPPLTPVVVDRQSGVARWIFQCGNPILEPANWVPQGPKICGPEQPVQPAAAPAPAAPQTPAPVTSAEMLVSGELRVVHGGEIRHVHETLTPPPAQVSVPETQPRKGWWAKNWKWIVPVAIAAGAGAAVAFGRGGEKTINYQPLPPPLYRP